MTFRISFGLAIYSCVSWAQLTEVEIVDNKFIEAVKIYSDSAGIDDQKKGVIVLRFASFRNFVVDSIGRAAPSLECVFRVTMINSYEYLQFNQPYYYFYFHKRPVVIITGLEQITKHGRRYLKDVKRAFANNLDAGNFPIEYGSIWFSIRGNLLKIEKEP